MTTTFRLLNGTVHDLEVSIGQQEFFNGYQRQAGAAAAAALAAVGLAGVAASGAMVASGGSDAVEFFSCRIEDAVVAGSFSKVTFKEGDHVSAAVECGRDGSLIARGILRPCDAMLWMQPHCSRGRAAHKRYCLGISYKIVLALAVVFSPLLWRAAHGGNDALENLEFFGMIYGVMAVTIALYYSIRFYWQWKSVSVHAEDIFRTLGYKNPKAVDLPRDNAKVSRTQGISWPYNSDGPWIYRSALANPQSIRSNVDGTP